MDSALYIGWLSHRRHSPRPHAFRYGLFMVLLDLSELQSAFAGRLLWSTSRRALARFDRRDYFGDPAVPLDESVRRLVAEATGNRPQGPVRLLTHLRYFGYSFNPVSFYFCFAPDGNEVEAIVAEVTNTPWGERHCYVLRPSESGGWLHAQSGKSMHVSPFHPMGLAYDWRFQLGDGPLRVAMALRSTEGEARLPVFHALLSLKRVPITTASLAWTLIRYPFMTAWVMAAIHFEALRLWLKRVPVIDHPAKRIATENPP